VTGLRNRFQQVLDRFLFESCDPIIASVLRIGYASLLIINVCVWMLDGNRWFSDVGVLKAGTVQHLSKIPYWSAFSLSSSTEFVQIGLSILLFQSVLLLVGCWSRFQAACIFFWLVSFQHRNPLICDGEDTAFRLLAFFFIFLPLDHACSVTNLFRSPISSKPDKSQAWGLRLIQVEISAIYLSAGLSKLQGTTWRDGSAIFYVFSMDDYMGRLWLTDWVLDIPWIIRFATWAALSIEIALPFALWWKHSRLTAILVGIGLHFAIELSMNLFLFEWLMILGLLSFLKPADWKKVP